MSKLTDTQHETVTILYKAATTRYGNRVSSKLMEKLLVSRHNLLLMTTPSLGYAVFRVKK